MFLGLTANVFSEVIIDEVVSVDLPTYFHVKMDDPPFISLDLTISVVADLVQNECLTVQMPFEASAVASPYREDLFVHLDLHGGQRRASQDQGVVLVQPCDNEYEWYPFLDGTVDSTQPPAAGELLPFAVSVSVGTIIEQAQDVSLPVSFYVLAVGGTV
jgi:hypothetical protein